MILTLHLFVCFSKSHNLAHADLKIHLLYSPSAVVNHQAWFARIVYKWINWELWMTNRKWLQHSRVVEYD